MNDLEKYFRKNNKRLIQKWVHYFDIYDRHFRAYRNKEIVILEIGVYHGGSLQMWKNYFGNQAKIYGIDIDPRCKELEEKNIKIFIGSQSDRKFLRMVTKIIPKIDILIDDGGHTMREQIISFQELFEQVSQDGIYLCEDLHTSYWLRYGGGHKRKGTFVEFSKNWIDYLNAFHSDQNSLRESNFTRTVNSIHYYDGIVIIEKKIRTRPYHDKTGHTSLTKNKSIEKAIDNKIRIKLYIVKKKLIYLGLTVINKSLRFLRLPGIIWK